MSFSHIIWVDWTNGRIGWVERGVIFLATVPAQS